MVTTVTTFVTVPPSTFDFHYWYFGVIVTLMITALILGFFVDRLNVPIGSDTFIIVALLGFFVGSLISLMLNVFPWEVPTVVFLSLLFYLWRGRG